MPDIIDREQEFMDLLTSEWGSGPRGYDVNDGSLPLSDSIENVGAKYPSLIISSGSEDIGGGTGYDFLSPTGPGSNNDGSLVATVRAQDDANNDRTYENDGGTAVRADTIAKEIVHHVREIARSNPTGGSSEFATLGAVKDYPEDDTNEDPPVRIESCSILYSFVEEPD